MDKDTRHNDVYLAALAGLLHDVGKFAQRAGMYSGRHADIGEQLVSEKGPLNHLIPQRWWDDVGDVIKYHHGGDTHKAVTQAVRVADWLAASEREAGPQVQQEPGKTPLIPVTARLSLQGPSYSQKTGAKHIWGYPLGDRADGHVLFPEKGIEVSQADFERIWGVFEQSAGNFPGPVNSFIRMAGLLDLFAETLTYIPSATPWEAEEHRRTTPDVSLYDHSRMTAAIAVCLMRLNPDELSQLHCVGWKAVGKSTITVARLFKVDFSGIQNFIYRITEPTDERGFRHTAKRLRGRSLYIALLNRAVADWLANRLSLPPTNILYASGGVIEILLPSDHETKQRLSEAVEELSDGMWQAFSGDLGFVYAMTPMQPRDFANVSDTRMALEQRLACAKDRKWSERLKHQNFFDREEIYHTCAVCGLAQVSNENDQCELCKEHKEIGQNLPYTDALIYSDVSISTKDGISISLPPPMKETLRLVKIEERKSLLDWANQHNSSLFLQIINFSAKETNKWPVGSAPGHWPIANAAPILEKQVYDFEQIAALSRGAQVLGILRADVDHMGLHFSHGLHPPTFSRSAALSQTISRFFGPYLNELTKELTEKWRESLDEEMREALNTRTIQELQNIFYVLYAGGDDLFVVGPWDQMVTFALCLARKFKAYTCENEELTLSAGLIFVKPHFPVQQFARIAGEAEHAAKSAGRNRIHFFDRTLAWDQAEKLINIARDWMSKDIPCGLIHDLGQMGRTYVEVAETEKPLFTPRLYYALTRRLQRWRLEERQTMIKQIIDILPDIVVPVSYASLSTRKE